MTEDIKWTCEVTGDQMVRFKQVRMHGNNASAHIWTDKSFSLPLQLFEKWFKVTLGRGSVYSSKEEPLTDALAENLCAHKWVLITPGNACQYFYCLDCKSQRAEGPLP